VKKYCNFCGEPMSADDKECKQCGWDLSKNAPPSTDPGDNKARLGVAAGLIVAYGVMSFLIQGTPAEARAEPARATQYAAAPEPRTEPVSEPAMAIGTLPQSVSSAPAASTASSALITIKVADLLTDDDYVFWHANPAAIAPSQWETFRGSETTLDYALPGPGTYHFVVSNQMSPTPQTVAVKAQVKCVR